MKYSTLRDWLRFIARLLILPFYLLKGFVELDTIPTWKALKMYLFEDYVDGKYLAERKAGW